MAHCPPGEAASKLQCTAPEKAIPIWGLYACWETEGDKAILEDYSACGHIISENHSVIAYNDVLTLGIDGILEKIEVCRQKNGDSSFLQRVQPGLESIRQLLPPVR